MTRTLIIHQTKFPCARSQKIVVSHRRKGKSRMLSQSRVYAPPDQVTVYSEKTAIFNLMVEKYWNTLDDTKKKVYRLHKQEYTHCPNQRILICYRFVGYLNIQKYRGTNTKTMLQIQCKVFPSNTSRRLLQHRKDSVGNTKEQAHPNLLRT